MQNHVLIVGASGLVGTAAANSFAAAGWRVSAISRRRPELISPACEHLPLDLQDPSACQLACQRLSSVTHMVYAAVYELPGLIQGWRDPHQIETNGKMFANLLQPLAEAAPLQHVSLLQGTKAYGAAVQPMRVPAKESQPRVEHANFYWLQEDHLRQQAVAENFAWTIFRPQLIVGPNHGVVMNLPPVIGIYAALRQAEGKTFSFPGGPDWVWEAVDARLVGDACLWAATADIAAGETYNLTNGEVFLWRDLWPALAAVLEVDVGADEALDVAAYLDQRHAMWDEIVAAHHLAANSLNTLVGQSHHYANLCFAHDAETPPPPTFVSTVKIKQHGFTNAYNTETSFCHWLRDLRDRKIIP